ncbi:MAG: dinitrogenase iron-molybdenum cofactor biosynthesis protein [Desulfovibrionaceae bacterium]|nr:dinitrogenase iron-molybdenum cofactor biosynthesis protein [Desulfovibrionaceae bacterium]
MKTATPELICLACYRDRLASVCENADGYKLFEIRDDKFYPAGLLSLPSKDPMDRTSAILACGVTTFLCGAIRNQTRRSLEAGGITVLPWITGSETQVLRGYLKDSLADLAMPGTGV